MMSKVLLINDCRFESLVLKDMLNNLGYDVEIADEYTALEKVKFTYPDIVIANLIMKNTQGDQLIEKIKQSTSEIKCVLSSSNDIKIEDYRDKRVDVVIHTPVNKLALQEALGASIKPHTIEKQESKFNFCPYCGDKLNGSFAFCPYCGHKM
jgi:CheY-like chemotaxis protein